MKHINIAIAFLAFTLCAHASAHAQARKIDPPVDTGVLEVLTVPLETPRPTVRLSSETVFGGVEQQPQFPGGTHAMYKFIGANLRIPSKARKAGVSGRVFVSFTIEVTGEITNVSVMKGLGFGCDEEAVRLVESMPRWKPGRQFDKIVKVRYNLPISFKGKE